MRFDKHHLLWFGPLTVLIEWIALIIGIIYLKGFDSNNAISSITVAAPPFPVIFGVTLTTVAITYSLFSVPLRQYSKYVPIAATVAGIAFIITGWTPYTGTDGVNNVVHNLASFVAVCGYVVVVWLLREHPKRRISQASKLAYKLMLLGVIAAALGIYATQKYIALAQLSILFVIQVWTVFIVWHEWKSPVVQQRF